MHLGRKCMGKCHSLTYYRKYFLNFDTTESYLIGQRDKFKDPKSNRNKCVSQISLISGIKKEGGTPQILPKKIDKTSYSFFHLRILPSILRFWSDIPSFPFFFLSTNKTFDCSEEEKEVEEEDNKTDVTYNRFPPKKKSSKKKKKSAISTKKSKILKKIPCRETPIKQPPPQKK